ncbi:MAG: peptidoglycan recognition family protein [bacterium]
MEPRDVVPLDQSCAGSASVPGLAPEILLAEAVVRGDFRDRPDPLADAAIETRRAFLQSALLGGSVLALAACSTTMRSVRVPPPEWSDVPSRPAPAPTVAAKPIPKPVSRPMGEVNPVGEAALPWAKPRFLWAKGTPDVSNLNPMLPVTAITVHHDGMDDLVYATDTPTMAARIERYRVAHRGNGWADIGYHLVIDRAGTLWQGRAIRWQGAHVKNRNEGNVGVLVMGNFERQQPTAAQMRTLDRVLRDLMRTYRVPKSRVYTHREWPDAQTACPGRNLQPKVASLRTRLA